MSAIQYLVHSVKRSISSELLIREFGTNCQQYGLDSMDYAIASEVIQGMVIRDMNLQQGIEVYIPITKASVTFRDAGSVAYHWTSDVLDGHDITQPLGVYLLDQSGGGFNYGNTPMGAASVMVDQTTAVEVENTKIRMVAPNTVLVIGDSLYPHMFLKTILSNDPELTNIPRGAWIDIGRLSQLAAKAIVYNNLRNKIQGTALTGGFEIGGIEGELSEFSSALDDYYVMLEEETGAIQFMSDTKQHADFISVQADLY